MQEKLRCRCEAIITADPPAKVYEKARFGPTFMAQVVVSKCADSLPLYRQAKAYRRAGVQVDDSTLGELFHRVAVATKPLSQRLLQLVAEKEIVLADETTQRVQGKGKTRTAWLWSFIARDEADKEVISYVFSRSRSGETPLRVLGDTLGKLVADAYSGYNKVTLPGKRERAGCLAHLRRKFSEAQSTAPDAAKRAIEAAQQLWYVCQTTTDRRGEIVAVEQRYFVTSIPTGALTRDQELALVRMHWAIENGCHWTMDVMLGEDEGHPSQASRASIETVSWLRLIGYNAVSAWRTLAPRKDGKPVAWGRAMETLRDALLAAQVTDHRELASTVT